MAFIVMGFVDIVGVATGYIKKDFGLTDSLAQLIPSMALFWFFVLSVPSGILQDKFGKRNEISGLMVMAISGGAFIPPVMGLLSASYGAVASFGLLVAGMVYMVFTGIYAIVKG